MALGSPPPSVSEPAKTRKFPPPLPTKARRGLPVWLVVAVAESVGVFEGGSKANFMVGGSDEISLV